MKKYWLRSTLFNITFFVMSLGLCIIVLPSIFLPRPLFMRVAYLWLWLNEILEKYILGLRYEVRGLEHLPPSGSYIVGAKHQSSYETFKLHALFGDPAIVLKKELLRIPLWGAYLNKSDVIAIDRTTPDTAILSIQSGAKRMKAQGRPIVIFPQGTRAGIEESATTHPYKIGIARIQEAADLPVIPMALNTGYFYPKSSWLKRPGTVIFEFLPPIPPGTSKSELLKQLESSIEPKSQELVQEAIHAERDRTKSKALQTGAKITASVVIFLILLACASYTAWWHHIAERVVAEHKGFLMTESHQKLLQSRNIPPFERESQNVTVSGFPGPVILNVEREFLSNPFMAINIRNIRAKSWPFPAMPIHVETGPITIETIDLPAPIEINSLQSELLITQAGLDLSYLTLRKDALQATLFGQISDIQAPYPTVDMTLHVNNPAAIAQILTDMRVLKNNSAIFVTAGLQSLSKDGIITIPVELKNRKFFLGPFLIATLPERSAARSFNQTQGRSPGIESIPAPRAELPQSPSPVSPAQEDDSLVQPLPAR